jgi:Co/Zn/Cd efflux system component
MCGAPVRDNTHITPIIIYVTVTLATISVIARCIARTDSFGLDDISALAAFVTGVAMAIIIVIMSAEGFGKDMWTLYPARITRLLQVSTSS